MNKKIILGTIAAAVVATSLFAAAKEHKSSYMNDNSSFGHSQKMRHGGFNMKKMIKVLNLTQEQKTQIKTIVKKHKSNQMKMSDAFTKTDFDKNKFIQIASQKRENMIKSKANMIEEVYTVLTKEQKLQLKVLMDLKMNKMMSKRSSSDKYSHGRG